MGGRDNAAPVIIKRKKVVGGGGHHGGAWKVAYADFVTAMMAFFMLMWLLNATTEKQRKGIADYFNPTVPINRISGGGDGAFGGESVFSESSIAQNGTGASSVLPSDQEQAMGRTGTDPENTDSDQAEFDAVVRKIEEMLMGIGGESMVTEQLAKHIVTRVTDEGLIVELSDLEGDPLFEPRTDEPTGIAVELSEMVARVFSLASNGVAVNGHLAAAPEVLRDNPVWDLSTRRAQRMRGMLESAGLEARRVERVTGYGDRKPALRNPMAVGNNRMELVLLRSKT
ncbi:flagellar motor protein MotB [Ostreiculturibacter nitratireducens]|uniref:flagellar motor protein MotB n=1 Tax=Ostreiculturibacter nitratireducens TaxID=3075226 RepID=UPI0031B5FCAF